MCFNFFRPKGPQALVTRPDLKSLLPDYNDDLFGHIAFPRFGVTDELETHWDSILSIADVPIEKLPIKGYETQIF